MPLCPPSKWDRTEDNDMLRVGLESAMNELTWFEHFNWNRIRVFDGRGRQSCCYIVVFCRDAPFDFQENPSSRIAFF